MHSSLKPENPLDEAVNQELQLAIKKLAELELTDESRSFLLAELYIQYGQNTKALKQLETLVNAESQVEIVLPRKEEVRSKLEAAKSEAMASRAVEQSSNGKETLNSLLEEVQTLRAFTSCGGCRTPTGVGRWAWATPNWFCKRC